MRSLPHLIGLAIVVSINCSGVQNVFGQSPGLVIGAAAAPPTSPDAGKSPLDATATITFATAQSLTVTSRRGLSDRIGLLPNQSVDVTVKFASSKVGHAINIDALDGGHISGAGFLLSVAADNTTKFTFQAAGSPGIGRVTLRDGAQEIGLEFWVLDQMNPQLNPLTINNSGN